MNQCRLNQTDSAPETRHDSFFGEGSSVALTLIHPPQLACWRSSCAFLSSLSHRLEQETSKCRTKRVRRLIFTFPASGMFNYAPYHSANIELATSRRKDRGILGSFWMLYAQYPTACNIRCYVLINCVLTCLDSSLRLGAFLFVWCQWDQVLKFPRPFHSTMLLHPQQRAFFQVLLFFQCLPSIRFFLSPPYPSYHTLTCCFYLYPAPPPTAWSLPRTTLPSRSTSATLTPTVFTLVSSLPSPFAVSSAARVALMMLLTASPPSTASWRTPTSSKVLSRPSSLAKKQNWTPKEKKVSVLLVSCCIKIFAFTGAWFKKNSHPLISFSVAEVESHGQSFRAWSWL